MTKEPTKAQLQGKIAELEANVVMERDLRTRVQGDRKDAQNALEAERKAHNFTRDVLHSTELELAKTRGYLDARRDAEPPIMVPQSREGALASYADGTRSLPPTSGTWSDNANRSPWWHR